MKLTSQHDQQLQVIVERIYSVLVHYFHPLPLHHQRIYDLHIRNNQDL